MSVSRQIGIEAEGIVYRNPRPHVRAVHAWHPRLVAGKDGRIIVTFDLAQAVESMDYRTYISHSDDGGQSWSAPVRLYEDNLLPDSPRPSTHLARPSRMRDGDLVAIIGRYFRDDPNEGIINHANLGLVNMELLLARSGNDGRTWQPPQRIVPPVTGTGFEVVHPILELRDGRWLAPLATWHYGSSTPPYGDKAGVFVSTDQGRTWPTYLDVMNESAQGIIYFEQGLTELADGRVLAVAWAFDGKKGTTRSIDWAVSSGGAFTPFKRTCLAGETAKLVALPNGKVLCVYRGINPAGLCASLLDVQGEELRTTEPVVLWKGERTQMVGAASAGEELANLKLGSPHMIALDQDRVLVVFWCCIEGLFHIRWIRAKISNPCPGVVNPDHAARTGAAAKPVICNPDNTFPKGRSS